MAMLTANWTRLNIVGKNKILTWMPWRHIVKEAKLKFFYPKKLLQENVDPKYLFRNLLYWQLKYHGIVNLIPICRSQKLKIINAGGSGNRVPRYVHHVSTMQRGISFPCYPEYYYSGIIWLLYSGLLKKQSLAKISVWFIKCEIKNTEKEPKTQRQTLVCLC